MSVELERDEMWRAFRRFFFELADMEPPSEFVDRFEAAVRADERHRRNVIEGEVEE